MSQKNNTRLYTLIVLTIISAIFFILTIIPNSPIVSNNNACMDNEKALKMYASADINEKTKYIEKRNSQCKELIKYVKPESTYEKLDACNMVDSVMDASKHYMDLHKNEKSAVRSELMFLAKNVKKYNYCPQYNEVANYINAEYKNVR